MTARTQRRCPLELCIPSTEKIKSRQMYRVAMNKLTRIRHRFYVFCDASCTKSFWVGSSISSRSMEEEEASSLSFSCSPPSTSMAGVCCPGAASMLFCFLLSLLLFLRLFCLLSRSFSFYSSSRRFLSSISLFFVFF